VQGERAGGRSHERTHGAPMGTGGHPWGRRHGDGATSGTLQKWAGSNIRRSHGDGATSGTLQKWAGSNITDAAIEAGRVRDHLGIRGDLPHIDWDR
jgi:hypothetical protein